MLCWVFVWGREQFSAPCLAAGGCGGEMGWSMPWWPVLSPWWHSTEEKPLLWLFLKAYRSVTGVSLHCFPEASVHREQRRCSFLRAGALPELAVLLPAAARGRVTTMRQIWADTWAALSAWCGRLFSPCYQILLKTFLLNYHLLVCAISLAALLGGNAFD